MEEGALARKGGLSSVKLFVQGLPKFLCTPLLMGPVPLFFNNKQLPVEWKCANITPLYKKGCRADVSNYRPVSLTGVVHVCKLMESVLQDNIIEHFTANKLFSSKQFGFINRRQRHYSYYRFLKYGQSVWNREGRLM